MKKKIKIGVAIGISILAVIAIAYNIVFFSFRSQFRPYVKNFTAMQKNLSYYYNDSENGFLLNVKFPSYGTLTGNLAVQTADDEYALIIWPKVNQKTELGFQTAIKNPQVRQDRYLNVVKGKIELKDSKFNTEEKEKIRALEKEAKKIWGKDIFK